MGIPVAFVIQHISASSLFQWRWTIHCETRIIYPKFSLI